jgi:hypothetical protein
MTRQDGRANKPRRRKGCHGWSKRPEREELWDVKAILDEDPVRREYLIDWDGIDRVTKRPYPPSWIPYSNLSHGGEARLAWETRKALLDEWQDVPIPTLSKRVAAAAARAAAETMKSTSPQVQPVVIDQDGGSTDSEGLPFFGLSCDILILDLQTRVRAAVIVLHLCNLGYMAGR